MGTVESLLSTHKLKEEVKINQIYTYTKGGPEKEEDYIVVGVSQSIMGVRKIKLTTIGGASILSEYPEDLFLKDFSPKVDKSAYPIKKGQVWAVKHPVPTYLVGDTYVVVDVELWPKDEYWINFKSTDGGLVYCHPEAAFLKRFNLLG